MLDIRYIRENTEEARRRLLGRGEEWAGPFDELLSTDESWRGALTEVNELRQRRNEASRSIPKMDDGDEKKKLIEEVRELKERMDGLEDDLKKLEEKRTDLLLNIPNLPVENVPVGSDEADNEIVRTWGEPKEHEFDAKGHEEIGESLGIIDFERGVKISGSGFYALRGDGAKLERALICFMLDLHAEQGYEEIFPTIIVNEKAMIGTGQLPKFKDDMYWIESDNMFLVPTAEVPLTNMLMDEILDEDSLPIWFNAYTPCFRREAGRHADTKGIIRVHQFNKVELVKFSTPESSFDELEGLTADAEEVLKRLKIPYRVSLLCTGDLGFSSAKTYDLEAYLPSRNDYVEISSCSDFTDYQARRANIRYRPKGESKPRILHTLNGSGIAIGRTMVAILDNYQQADGTVVVPEVLRPYMGIDVIEKQPLWRPI